MNEKQIINEFRDFIKKNYYRWENKNNNGEWIQNVDFDDILDFYLLKLNFQKQEMIKKIKHYFMVRTGNNKIDDELLVSIFR